MSGAGWTQPCSVEDCDRRVGKRGAKGLCPRHYQRMVSTGSPTGSLRLSQEARFFAKVRQNGDCWEWTASLDDSGYGLFWGDRMIRAHMWTYEFFVGPVPSELELDHLCHSEDLDSCPGGVTCPHRRCCNPWHLEAVTDLVNTRRGHRADPRHSCPASHPYDLGNTYINPLGRKVCRKCARASQARYQVRRKAA